jgi:predicted homoserine dehydrogenase-like protein
MVEVVTSVERDGRPVYKDLRWGVYVVIEAPNDYASACFKQYGMNTDSTGRYSAMYKALSLDRTRAQYVDLVCRFVRPAHRVRP